MSQRENHNRQNLHTLIFIVVGVLVVMGVNTRITSFETRLAEMNAALNQNDKRLDRQNKRIERSELMLVAQREDTRAIKRDFQLIRAALDGWAQALQITLPDSPEPSPKRRSGGGKRSARDGRGGKDPPPRPAPSPSPQPSPSENCIDTPVARVCTGQAAAIGGQ